MSNKTMMKTLVRNALMLLMVAMVAMPANAILKGKDINRTVVMLNGELKDQVGRMKQDNSDFERDRKEYWAQIKSLMSEERELALVMYSQHEKYLFGTAHAARRVGAMETEFEEIAKPMDDWRAGQKRLIHRYEEMLKTLVSIHDYELDGRSIAIRQEAIGYAKTLIKNAKSNLSKIAEDEAHYKKDYQQIKGMNDDAEDAFAYIQHLFFVRGGNSFSYYLAHPQFFGQAIEDIVGDVTFSYGGEYAAEWSARMYQILLCGLVAFVVGCILAWLFIRLKTGGEQTTERAKQLAAWINSRKGFLILLGGVTLLTATMLFMYVFVLQRNFFMIVAELMSEFCILVFVLMMATLYRVKADHVNRTMTLYAPTIVATGLLMMMRMFLVASVTISIFIVIILGVCAIWQLILNIKLLDPEVHKVTKACSWTAFAIFVATFVASWIGYHYVTMLIVMLWACLLTILAFAFSAYDVEKRMDRKYFMSLQPLHRLMVNITMRQIVLPFIILCLVVCGVYWMSHIFDIEDWVANRFAFDFINIPETLTVSGLRIAIVILLAVVINYLVFMLRSILEEMYGEQSKVGGIALIKQCGTILLWGIYVMSIMYVLSINRMGLLAAVSGMSVGIGIALKDVLDNVISGISLMMGRMHVGDVIECDGVRGTVKDIQYQDTLIETGDGAQIVFLNNQLFAKNFKNLTRNHGYEKTSFDISVAYGNDVNKVRNVILDAIKDVKDLDPNHKIGVSVSNFGGSVDLSVGLWVLVTRKADIMDEIREKIYRAFTENDIQLPSTSINVHNL